MVNYYYHCYYYYYYYYYYYQHGFYSDSHWRVSNKWRTYLRTKGWLLAGSSDQVFLTSYHLHVYCLHDHRFHLKPEPVSLLFVWRINWSSADKGTLAVELVAGLMSSVVPGQLCSKASFHSYLYNKEININNNSTMMYDIITMTTVPPTPDSCPSSVSRWRTLLWKD